MAIATFRFYEELSDFLAPQHRRRDFDRACARAATVKHEIEALGVPHTEVELVLVNGESAGFERIIRDGDRIAVYPKFERFDVSSLLRVRDAPLRDPRFVADAHLGALARLLRLTGFDTVYANTIDDDEIARLCVEEGRIVLTRDRELLKRRTITHGCYVRALQPQRQLHEIFARLDLAGGARPFTLCLSCNVPLRAVDKEQVADALPPVARQLYERFSTCDACRRVFWEGSHWRRLRAIVDEVLAGREGPSTRDSSGTWIAAARSASPMSSDQNQS